MNKVLALFLVLVLSLSLLIFIGFSEAKRVYPQLQLDNICSHAQLYKHRIEGRLNFGFDIQDQNFVRWTQDLRDQKSELISDACIIPLIGIDEQPTPSCAPESLSEVMYCDSSKHSQVDFVTMGWGSIFSADHDKYYAVNLDLNYREKSGAVGIMSLKVNSNVFLHPIHSSLKMVLAVSAVLLICALLLIQWVQYKAPQRLTFYGKFIFHICFAVVGFAVLFSLIGIFKEGIREKSSSLTHSLQSRLNVPATIGIDLAADLSNINEVLNDYLQQDTDISLIELYRGETLIYHASEDNYNSSNNSSACEENDRGLGFGSCQKLADAEEYSLKVVVPKSRVYKKLFRAVKNLLVLFIATTLVSNLFLNLLAAFQSSVEASANKQKKISYLRGESFIRPVFTLGVLTEALNLSFLPAYLRDTIGPEHSISTIFSFYFMCFAFALIPAGRYAAKHNLRSMMSAALILCFVGLFLLSISTGFYSALLARGISACGQAILLIAVQSYLLRIDDGSSASSGASVIVLGFNIGTISGTAIGALLVSILDEQPVFKVGMLVSLFCIACVYWLVVEVKPTDSPITNKNIAKAPKSNLFKTLFNYELLQTTVLVGIPAKAVFTGVLIFALPVILAYQNFEQDLIGQILIFYSIGILLTTYFIDHIFRWFGSSALILLVGCVGAGAGLMIIGAQDWIIALMQNASICQKDCTPYLPLIIVVGVFVLGLSHGFIYGPIFNYITKVPGTATGDRPIIAANYRMLERFGHMVGPTVAASILIAAGGEPLVINIFYLGGAIAGGGLLFFLSRRHWGSAQ